MAKATKTKLEQAIEKAVVKKPKIESISQTGYYDEKDLLKHYIRKQYWRRRIEILRRDNAPILGQGIRYFTFCSKYAYDVRYFISNRLINLKGESPPFVFVEFLKDDFDFLSDRFISRYRTATGFYGSLAEIATSSSHKDYGEFWGTFPYDVINLDYLGDILKTNTDRIGENDFYAIQSIIFKQSLLRRPYELWITMRAKQGRFENVVKQEFRKIIQHNVDNYKATFGARFNDSHPGISNASELDDEHLFLTGYIKWLMYVSKQCYSVVDTSKLQVIRYNRKDKDGSDYFLYNLFLRIAPYEYISIPSPAGDAAQHSETEYKNGILHCFLQPTDITAEFDRLSTGEKLTLNTEMQDLYKEYLEDESGYIR